MKNRNYLLLLCCPLLTFLILALVSACGNHIPYDIPENIILSPKDASARDLHKYDQVLIKATDIYRAGAIKRLMQGEGYRKAWDAPIEVPVVWLDTLHGGLKVLDEGGGGQTRSLDLSDPEGRIYTLRTVAKDPSKNIPRIAEILQMENIILDATSAGHPYGALAVAPMADALGIYHTHPRLVYLPSQPGLNNLKADYDDRLFLLEYEPEGDNGDWVGCDSVEKLMESDNVMRNILESPLHQANQSQLLRARIFDLMIGDWDRHKGNWGWAKCPRGDKVIYEPIAADRDMAFYGIGGAIPSMMTLPFLVDKFRPFKETIDYFPGMLVNSADFDPFYLNRMTRSDFQEAAILISNILTDEIIERAIRSWPDTIYRLDGPQIIKKLKARRDKLSFYAQTFYEVLAEEVEVMGTHQQDHFIITSKGKDELTVEVFTRISNEQPRYPHYKRTFRKGETCTISLFGWDENDIFEINGDLPDIKINIVGGEGDDQLKSRDVAPLSNNKIVLYDDEGGIKCPKECKTNPKKIKAKLPEEK